MKVLLHCLHTHVHVVIGCCCSVAAGQQKLFLPRETEVFVKLLRYGLVALDIYRVTVLPNGAHSLRNSK